MITSGSKLIDLRDCSGASFQRIYQDMVQIQWGSHSLLARWIFRAFGKGQDLKPIWSRRWEYPWAILNAGLCRGLTVLDAGCGNSPLLPYLAEKWGDSLSLEGVDKGDEGTLNWKGHLLDWIGYRPVNRFRPVIDRGVNVRKEPLDRMSFDDDSFDRIFCISVMEHLSPTTRPSAVREMARVLKTDGLVLMTVDLPRDDPNAAEPLIWASGLQLVGKLDYSIPRSQRHGFNYEVGGLVLVK